MCGIAGVFSFSSSRNINGINLIPVLNSMIQRGPDAFGVRSGQCFQFGHRRLSILDLEGGIQPWVDDNGFALTYNGELYNFKELRKELQREGLLFKTDCDTEVVLQAWKFWGRDCLSRFNGMFAFAVFDPRNQSVTLVRDHVGVKPLFYYEQDGCLYFASTLAALLKFEGAPRKLNLDAASHYLSTVRPTLGEATLIDGIKTLEPGTLLDASNSNCSISTWWEIPCLSVEEKAQLSLENDPVEEVVELMSASVEGQLISDVPLGGFLSGGIDSSVIASLACPMTNGNFNAYSVGYERESLFGEKYQEWDYVREAAKYMGMACKEIVLDEDDYAKDWSYLISEKGLPLSTPNEVGIYRLSSALRQDYTVALSGEGADEIFGGYVTAQYSALDYDRSIAVSDNPDDSFRKALRRMYGADTFSCLADHFFKASVWMPFDFKFQMLNGSVRDQLKGDEGLLTHYLGLFEAFKNCSSFDSYMQLHARKNLEGLLFRLDSSTMAASVEGRVPFTDPRLVELLFKLPDNLKMDWFDGAARDEASSMNVSEADAAGLISSKILLRHAFRDKIPSSILSRKKMSFPVPFREWMGGPLKPFVKQLLNESIFRDHLFDGDALDAILENSHSGNNAMALWPVVNLCLWQLQMGVEM